MVGTQTSLQFDIGICRLFPGEKLPPGDPCWGQHTRSFMKERHTIESLARAIAVDGYAVSAVMKDYHRKGDNFVSSQHLGLDCDQETWDSSIEGLQADPFIADYAAIIHETVSSTPDKPRSRVLFILDQPITDSEQYRIAAEALIHKYGASDEHCKDPARLFFGCKNAHHVALGNILYRDVLQEQVVEPYLMAKASNNGHSFAGPIPDAVIEGDRNKTLASLAGSMRRRGMGEAAILAALRVENETRCQPSLEDDEVRGIAHSVARYEPGNDNRHHSDQFSLTLADEPWPDLGKVPELSTPPALLAEMIPEPLRPWLMDTARHTCLPLEMVTAPALVAVSSVVGRRLGIRPNRYSNYVAVPNLWGEIIARPGAMKSYALEQGIRPVKRLAATAHERFQAEQAMATASIAGLKAEIDGIKSKMRQTAKNNESLEALKVQLGEKLAEMDKARPSEQRYWVSDATIEKLQEILMINPQGVLVAFDELAGWFQVMERSGREGDREFSLAAWEGTGDYYVDRISRGSLYIPAVCLSVVGGIQPDKLKRYVEEAMSKGSAGDGMLQRFQMMVWIDNLGDWDPPQSWPDNEAKELAYQVFKSLDEMKPLDLGAISDSEGGIPYLRFSPDAQALYDLWRSELENRLRGDDLKATPAFEPHLGKYRSLMPSLALIFHLLECVTSGTAILGVSLEATQLAADWCDFLEQPARVVYSAEVSPGLDAAHRLAEKIQTGQVRDGEPVRDVYRHHWSGLATATEVNAGLEVLAQAGWVRTDTQATAGAPITVIHLHPDLRGGESA